MKNMMDGETILNIGQFPWAGDSKTVGLPVVCFGPVVVRAQLLQTKGRISFPFRMVGSIPRPIWWLANHNQRAQPAAYRNEDHFLWSVVWALYPPYLWGGWGGEVCNRYDWKCSAGSSCFFREQNLCDNFVNNQFYDHCSKCLCFWWSECEWVCGKE